MRWRESQQHYLMTCPVAVYILNYTCQPVKIASEPNGRANGMKIHAILYFISSSIYVNIGI